MVDFLLCPKSEKLRGSRSLQLFYSFSLCFVLLAVFILPPLPAQKQNILPNNQVKQRCSSPALSRLCERRPYSSLATRQLFSRPPRVLHLQSDLVENAQCLLKTASICDFYGISGEEISKRMAKHLTRHFITRHFGCQPKHGKRWYCCRYIFMAIGCLVDVPLGLLPSLALYDTQIGCLSE